MSVRTLPIVGKLTTHRSRRHEFDARRAVQSCVFVFLLLGPSANAGTTAQDWEPTENIAAAAEQYLRDRIGPAAPRTTVQAGMLDSRHRLARCSQPLEPFLRRGTRIAARTIVGVRCAGEKPWKVYVPVDVVVTDKVLVARRTLPRGHVLVKDDLVAEQRDVSRLVSGYLSKVEDLLGQRLKTQLIAGRMLTPAMLQADIAVKRGQAVTLTINSGGISIQTGGKALMDGAINQRIKVENTNSGRVVEGIVRSREHVEVLVAESQQFTHAKPKVSPPLADIRSSNNDR
jgi:flagella basal body P-ring formation protein FlgA